MCCRPSSSFPFVRPCMYIGNTRGHTNQVQTVISPFMFLKKKLREKRERERLILATAAGNVIRSPPPFFFSSPLTGTVGFRHFWVTLGHKMILQSDTRALFLLLLLFLYFVVVSVILDCCWSYVMPNNNNNIIVPAPNHILPSYIVLYAYMHVK